MFALVVILSSYLGVSREGPTPVAALDKPASPSARACTPWHQPTSTCVRTLHVKRISNHWS